ncbi:hypothetical protein AMTRI_Chr07g79680 [Amborella trichopoda]
MSVAAKKMLRSMSGKTRRDRIRNESIRENFGVAPIGDKMRERRLRWAGHVWHQPSTTPARRCKLVQVEGLKRARDRPKMTWLKIVRKDMGTYGLTEGMAFNKAEWRTEIRVANPK